jgi:hypothetical protein
VANDVGQHIRYVNTKFNLPTPALSGSGLFFYPYRKNGYNLSLKSKAPLEMVQM